MTAVDRVTEIAMFKRVIVASLLVVSALASISLADQYNCRDDASGTAIPGCLFITPASRIGAAAGGAMTFSWGGVITGPSSCNAPVTVEWTLGGPNGYEQKMVGNTASFTFPSGGYYNLFIRASASCPCTDCNTAAVCNADPTWPCGRGGEGKFTGYPVFEPPAVTGLVSYPQMPLVDKPVTFIPTSTFPNSPTEADWKWGDGKECKACGTSAEHTYELPGVYDVTITARNPAGTVSQTFKVTVYPDPPTVTWGFATLDPIIAGTPVKFSSTIGGGELNRTILWDFGDGTTSSEEDPTHTFPASDDYLVSMSVSNKWATTRSAEQVSVGAKGGGSPPVAANFTFDPAMPVTGQQVRFFDASTGSISRWRWNFDFNPSQSFEEASHTYQQNPTWSYPAWGRKNVELWVSNEYGRKGIVLFVDVLKADQPPLANFTWSPQVPRVNEIVQFTDTSAGATMWSWDFGDGATSTAQHPTHAFSNGGQQKVTLKVTNAYGSDTITKYFACELPGGATLAAAFSWSPQNPKPGQEVVFADGSSGNPDSWLWKFGDGTEGNVQNPRHTYAAAGQYTVNLRVNKSGQTAEVTHTVIVANQEKPVANFTWSPANPRANQPVSFINQSAGNPTSFAWSFGDGSSSTAESPTHSFAAPRSYIVTLTVANEIGSDSTSRSIDVAEEGKKPKADFTFSPPAPKIGQPVTFTDTSTNDPKSWQWSFGDGATGSGRIATHAYAAGGTYAVSLTVANDEGTDTKTSGISVEVPPPLAADFVSSTADIITEKPVQFTDRSSGSPDSWLWDFGDGTRSTEQNPVHTFNREGAPEVSLTVTKGGENKTNSKPMAVFAPPVAQFATAGEVAVGVPVRFIDRSKGPARDWKWTVDGEVASREPTFTRQFDSLGDIRVQLEVGNPAGRDRASRALVVGPRPDNTRPVISKVIGKGPCFYSQLPIDTPIEVAVDWKALTPQAVTLTINGGQPASFDVGNVIASDSIFLNSEKLAYFADVNENTITLKAKSKEGPESDPQKVTFFSFPLPGYLREASTKRQIVEPSRTSWSLGRSIPPKALELQETLPDWVPIFGGLPLGIKKTQFKIEQILRTDCSVYSYAELGGGLVAAGGVVGIKGTATAETKLSKAYGIAEATTWSLAVEGFGTVERKQSLVEAMPIMKGPCSLKVLKPACDTVQVKLEMTLAIGGAWEFKPDKDGYPLFKKFLFTAKPQILIAGVVEAGGIKAEVIGGGKGGVGFGPWTATPFFQKADFGFELLARATYKIFLTEYKEGAGCTYDASTLYQWKCGAATKTGQPALIQSAPAATLKLMPRISREQKVEESAEGDPVVLRNVSTLADPAMATRGDRALVVFVSENESMKDSAHRTDLRFVRGSGSPLQWDAPATLTSDANGDFNPAVVWTSASTAVAAWERFANAASTFSDVTTIEDLAKVGRELEIAASVFDGTSWAPLTVLTSNQQSDTAPALAALADGRVLLVWLREAADGSGSQQIVTKALQNGTWSGEQVLGGEMKGIGRLALASRTSTATLVVGHDRDGDSATTADRDLASFEYRDGAWGARRDVTSDAEDDSAPLIVYEGDTARLYWARNGKLASRLLPDGPIEIVRDDERTDLRRTVAAWKTDGTAILAWPSGTDVYGRIRDSHSKQWSGALELVSLKGTSSDLAAAFTDDGLLHVTGLETAITYSDLERVVDGQKVTIEQVPSPGRVDLVDYTTALHVDLAAVELTAEPRNPQSGESVTFFATVENRGRIAVRDVPVELRNGTSVLTTTTVAGDWAPGERRQISLATSFGEARRFTVTIDPTSSSGDVQPANNTLAWAFDNAAPRACLQASTSRGATPLSIAFDSGCSLDTDGTIVSRRWLFGDGDFAEGNAATHVYATRGVYTATLLLADDAGGTGSASIEIDAGSSEGWRSAHSPYSLYVPVVGRARGVAASFFVTDVSIRNTDTTASVDLDAVYIPDGKSEFHRRITLQGGEVRNASDLLATVFGATDGVGSLRIDPSHPHVTALARTYNQQPGGTAGFSANAVRRESALFDGESGTILQHWLPGFRTNLGFTEISGKPAEVTAAAYSESGSLLGTQVFAIGPYEHRQFNSLPLFQNRGRIDVSARGGTVLSYAATNDDRTGDPIYQTADRRPPAATATSLLVPVVGRLRGLNNSTWRSDVRVFNAAPSAQKVTVQLRTGSGIYTTTFDVAANAMASFDDVISALFPQLTGDLAGPLAISAAGPLLVTSRTFNLTTGGTYGMYIPARSASELLKAGETGYLLQVQENDTYRCNLGLTSFDAPGRVIVRALDASGKALATREYAVAAGQNAQIGRIIAAMGVPNPAETAALEVTVAEGTLFVYASVIDNRTGDTTFVEVGR